LNEPYELNDPFEPERARARARVKALLARYNGSGDDERNYRSSILRELLGRVGPGAWIEPPFYCDYGSNILVGERFYANTGCVVLDCETVEIGARVKLGPNVQLLAVSHPLDAAQRALGLEYGEPISIGDDVWVGGGAIVLGGVTIGDRAVVGAGSVVTRDVPADMVVAGNPARPLVRDQMEVQT
jgi:maltose O-acetyltransferase